MFARATALREDLGEAGADDFLDEGGRQGLVDGELDGAFGDGEGLQVRAELFDHRGSGEKGTMLGEGSKPDYNLFVVEGRNAVGDRFGGLAGNSGANRSADFLERGALRFRSGGEIFVDGGRSLFAF